MRFSRLRKYKRKHRSFWFVSKIVAVCYIILFSTLYLTSDTGAVFLSEKETRAGIHTGYWEPEAYSLEFIEKGNKNINSCEAQEVTMKIKNKGPGAMEVEGEFYIYFSEKQGNPKQHGSHIDNGIIPVLKNGDIGEVSYKVSQPGFYQFKVINSDSEEWSEIIIFCRQEADNSNNNKEDKKLEEQNHSEKGNKPHERTNVEDESIEEMEKDVVDKKEENNENSIQESVEENSVKQEITKDETQVQENTHAQDLETKETQIQEETKKENIEQPEAKPEENTNEEEETK